MAVASAMALASTNPARAPENGSETVCCLCHSDGFRHRRQGWRHGPSPVDRLDQERQLRRRQLQAAVDDRRPNKAALLQPFCEQAQARAVPVEDPARLLRKMKRWPENGSPRSTSTTLALKPSKPERMLSGRSAKCTFVPGRPGSCALSQRPESPTQGPGVVAIRLVRLDLHGSIGPAGLDAECSDIILVRNFLKSR